MSFNPNKTEFIFVSNTLSGDALKLQFQNTVLSSSNTHKHLGVTLSSNAKWSDHINNVFDSCSKKINVLRKLKYILSKSNILKLYRTFILPILEYASEVWDGCTEYESNRLENLQLEVARIACGLPLFCSKENLYKESGLEPLASRRKRKKLVTFYKIHSHLTPSYLSNLLPQHVGSISNYNLRNQGNYSLPQSRLTSYSISYFPSTRKLWNDLNIDTREKPTISSFRSAITPQSSVCPKYYNIGNRKVNIAHTRLRNMCSSLNYDLYRSNLIVDQSCSCGAPCENARHYFFECLNFAHIRGLTISKLNHNLNVKLLLCGEPNMSLDFNEMVFRTVQTFIAGSKRF